MIVSLTLVGPANAATGKRETLHKVADYGCSCVPAAGDVLVTHGQRWLVVSPRVHVKGSVGITAKCNTPAKASA